MGGKNANSGLAVLVGAGPGDATLVTAAAIKWLTGADTILYDRLSPAALLALTSPDAEKICVGKTPGGPSLTQEQINALLIEKCSAGRLVVRLKGGDPFVFGRGGEEAGALADAGIPFRIVPGVTAGIAAAAFAGIPLTDRRAASTVAFVTGQEAADKAHSSIDWASLARIETLVFYMGVAKLEQIAQKLIAAGREPQTPTAVVQNASTPTQRTVVAALCDIAQRARTADIKPPAVVIVGGVVDMRRQLAWFEKLPLFGSTVLVTRPQSRASQLADPLLLLGANVIEAPAIRIDPPEDFRAVDAAVRDLRQFDWIVFTSPNGVEALLGRIEALQLDARALGGAKIAAVGPATAEALGDKFLRADLIPDQFTTEALGQALTATTQIRGKNVLLARADVAHPQLPQVLRSAGAKVTNLAVYRTVRPDALCAEATEVLRTGRVDWITFTSSSTVENLLALLDDDVDISPVKLAAIGPVTADAIRRCGLAPTAVAEPHTIGALVAAIVAHEQQ